MTVSIPIEVLSITLGLAITLGVIGLWKKQPHAMIIAGCFIAFVFVNTDAILLGKIPLSSTVSGSTTTYVFTDNPYTLGAWDKIILSMIGAVMFIVGALVWKYEES